MRVWLLAAFLFAVLDASGAASALSISNRDGRDHKVTIVEAVKSTGSEKSEHAVNPTAHMLKPNAMLESVCTKGCIIRLNDGPEDEYELEGNEVVSIEEGKLYYDGPLAPAPPPADAGRAGERKGSGQSK